MTQLMLADAQRPLTRRFTASGSWKAMLQSVDSTPPLEAFFAVEERAGSYVLKALIPGASQDELKIDFDAGKLRVRSATEVRYTDGGHFDYVRRAPVDETFTLPSDAETETAVAKMHSGVLCVTIPRKCIVTTATAATAAAEPALSARNTR